MKLRINGVATSFGLIGLGCLAVVALSPVLGAAPPRGSDMKISVTVGAPRIIAVRFHHDLCPFCKALEPEFSKLIRRTDEDSVLFLTLDLTSKSTQRQAALLVGALGLEHVWPGDLSKLGTVTFVDGRSKEIVSTYSAAGAKSIGAAVAEAVKSSRSKR